MIIGKKRLLVSGAVLGAVALLGLCLGVTFYLRAAPTPTPGGGGVYTKAAVVSNSPYCARIGGRILREYGSAVDAGIATLICEGVHLPQFLGLGGGFLLTHYDPRSGVASSLVARETAPAAATPDMFNGRPELSRYGGLGIGVPGEVRGYAEAHRKLGGAAPWRELFADTLALCKAGDVKVAPTLAAAARSVDPEKSPELRELLTASGEESGGKRRLVEAGDRLRPKKLCETLEALASEGAEILYTGRLAPGLVRDVRAAGGVITEQDLADYTVRWEDPVEARLRGGFRVLSAPLPGSGLVLADVLLLLDSGLLPSGDPLTDAQRITEAFKSAYAKRSRLGDPYFHDLTRVISEMTDEDSIAASRRLLRDNETSSDPAYYGADFSGPLAEDHGTANVAVLAPSGEAAVFTSTVNTLFGSTVVSASTGLILNNQMDDFSTPGVVNSFGVSPSASNLVLPGARPLSSMVPTVVVAPGGRPRLLVGAAGGTHITTATALTIIRDLWYGATLEEAVDSPRFHHQLLPMVWYYENGTSPEVVDGLRRIGHTVERIAPSSVATAIRATPSRVTARYDPRRPGSTDGF